jgi:hypothetical protein
MSLKAGPETAESKRETERLVAAGLLVVRAAPASAPASKYRGAKR